MDYFYYFGYMVGQIKICNYLVIGIVKLKRKILFEVLVDVWWGLVWVLDICFDIINQDWEVRLCVNMIGNELLDIFVEKNVRKWKRSFLFSFLFRLVDFRKNFFGFFGFVKMVKLCDGNEGEYDVMFEYVFL